MKSKIAAVLLSMSFLIACGGGGSSGDSGNANEPPNPAPGTPPIQTPPPVSNAIPDPLSVNYIGVTSDANIDEVNAGTLTVSILESLDLLNLLVLGDSIGRNQFFEDPSDLNLDDSESCSSGDSFLQNNTDKTVTTTTYSNCRLDDGVIDGTVVAFINSGSIAERLNINIDLQFTFDDGTNATMYGHVSSSSNEDYIYNFIVTGDGETFYFDKFLVNSESLGGLKVFNSGDIYVGSLGKINVKTLDVQFDGSTGRHISTLQLSGNEQLNVIVDNQFSLLINANFLELPLKLNLVGFEGLPETNLAPSLVILQTDKVTYSEPIQLDLSQSIDPNLDVISYTFNEGNSPEGSNLIMKEIAPAIFSVVTTRPGIYELEVVASDRSGLSDSTRLNLEFARKNPTGTINLVKEDFLLSEQVAGSLVITSEEYDGPFNVSLAYGPEGMALVDDQLVWDVKLPNLGSDIKVNFGIRIENPDASSLIEKTFTVHPERAPIISPLTISRTFSSATSSDLDVPNLVLNGIVFDLILNNDKTLSLLSSDSVSGLPLAQSQVLAVGDYNQDGNSDIIYYHFDEEQSVSKIILNTENDESKDIEILSFNSISPIKISPQSIDIGEFADTPGLEYYIRFLGNDFSNRLISTEQELLDSHVSDYGSDRLFCDINHDGIIDWISVKSGYYGYRLSGTNDVVPITLPEPFDTPIGPIITGLNAECNIVFESKDEFGRTIEYGQFNVNSPDNIKVFDYETAYQAFINRPEENFIRFPQIADINQNNEVDFYVSIPREDEEAGYLLIFNDVFTDNASTQVLFFDENTPDNLNFNDLKDIDNDGYLEHFVTIYGDNKVRLIVSKLLGDRIESYLGEWQAMADFELFENWFSDQVVSELPADISYQQVMSLDGYIDVRFEQGLTVTYANNVEQSMVTKATALGQELWTFNYEFDHYQISTLSDDLLITERIVYDRVTGEVIFMLPFETTLLRQITYDPIIVSDNDSVYFFVRVDRSGETSPYLRSYKIDHEKNVQPIDFPFIDLSDSSLGDPMNTGIENDLGLFFTKLKPSGLGYDKVGVRLDLTTSTIEELKLDFFERENNPRLGSLISLCYLNSKSCKTRPYIKKAFGTSAKKGVYGIDGITGFTVWETLDELPEYTDISVIETPTGLITLLEVANNIYSFE